MQGKYITDEKLLKHRSGSPKMILIRMGGQGTGKEWGVKL